MNITTEQLKVIEDLVEIAQELHYQRCCGAFFDRYEYTPEGKELLSRLVMEVLKI